MSEVCQITVDSTEYTVEKLSDYRLLKVYGGEGKDTADMYRDLIAASVIEPKLTKAEIEEMAGGTFLRLGAEIMHLYEDQLKDFQGSISSVSQST